MLAPGYPGFVIDETTFVLRMNVLEMLKHREDGTEVDHLLAIGESSWELNLASMFFKAGERTRLACTVRRPSPNFFY